MAEAGITCRRLPLTTFRWLLNNSEYWRHHILSEWSVPVLGHLYSEKDFPDLQTTPPVFQLMPRPFTQVCFPKALNQNGTVVESTIKALLFKHSSKPRRHNSVAVDLAVFCSDPCLHIFTSKSKYWLTFPISECHKIIQLFPARQKPRKWEPFHAENLRNYHGKGKSEFMKN